MIIDCIADLHGYYPNLEGGDLLIVGGDLTARHTEREYDDFWRWVCYQNYKKWIVIAGNHDGFLEKNPDYLLDCGEDFHYLCDSGTEFEGLKIWGAPWTSTFPGINPHCTAFTGTEEELAAKFKLIPDDTDILITHGPPECVLDWNNQWQSCGSSSLLMKATSLPNLKLFVFGHIHEAYGMIDIRKSYDELEKPLPNPRCKSFPIIVNCSHVNEIYQPVNKPVRIIL